MATLTVIPGGKIFDVVEGVTILNALRAAEIPGVAPQCGGKAGCEACHIFVHEGRKGLSKIGREENERLDQIVGVGSKSRLACLVTVLGTENVKIEIPGFASGL